MALPALAPFSLLDPLQPLGSQVISEGDDWLRYIQLCLKTYLVNIGGVVNASHTEMNFLVGVTSLIQAQLDLKASTANLAAVAVGSFVLTVETATAVTGVVGTEHALTNVAASTVMLPPTPAAGNTLRVTPANGLLTNTVARNGMNIHSLAQDMTIDNAEASVTLRYINATVGWRLI